LSQIYGKSFELSAVWKHLKPLTEGNIKISEEEWHILLAQRRTYSFVQSNNISMIFLMFMGLCIVVIFLYINPNKMHKSQSLFFLWTALHVSGFTITHLQEHTITVTTVSGNHYTLLLSAAIVEDLELMRVSVPTLPR